MKRTLVALCLLAASVASAETRRVAVVVGNNTGSAGQQPLRYAEVDAGKVARVLTELGGVASADLFVVKGERLPALRAVMAKAAAAITAYRRTGDRVVVIFYYSGHSDGLALELDSDRFTFSALREWLASTGAEVRLALVDSCKSGALVAAKGGSFGPSFNIRLTDEVSATGEALLTSSASDENALESTEIGGSFFTHHLVSGLRGAADASSDGRVTLNEAYEYAYKHTITTSGATIEGPQHPTYDYRLTGQGELVLTELSHPSAGLVVPAGFDRALVIEAANAQVIAEVGRGERPQIALAPGAYVARVWRGGKVFESRVTLAFGQVRAVDWQELREVHLAEGTAKGATSEGPGLGLVLAGGGRTSVGDVFDALGGGRVGVRLGSVSAAIDASSASTSAVRETSLFVVGGYRRAARLGPLRAAIGLELGGGAFVQRVAGMSHATGAAIASPLGELSLPVTSRLTMSLEVDASLVALKVDGEVRSRFLPSAWLGVVFLP